MTLHFYFVLGPVNYVAGPVPNYRRQLFVAKQFTKISQNLEIAFILSSKLTKALIYIILLYNSNFLTIII